MRHPKTGRTLRIIFVYGSGPASSDLLRISSLAELRFAGFEFKERLRLTKD